MTTCEDRKLGALRGQTVEHRDCTSLAQWNASDRWNHHTFDAGFPSEHTNIYGDDGHRAPPSTLHSQYGPMLVPPTRTFDRDRRSAHALRANMEFGLYRVPLYDTVLEQAPDQSRYVHPNMGDLGRIM